MRTYRWLWGVCALLTLGLVWAVTLRLRFGMMGQWQPMGPGMMGYGMGTGSMMATGVGGWALIMGWLVRVAFWVVLIGGVLILIMRASRPARAEASVGAESALAIARRRYAAGEIDRDTFVQMQRDLQDAATGSL